MTIRSNSGAPAFQAPRDFVRCLRDLAASRPAGPALVVVAERGGEASETVLTYAAFDLRVRALAADLQRRFAAGERVLILLDNDEHYAVGMFACFYAGVIAVPVFPPESTRPQHLARLAGIAADARARGILTVGALLELVGQAAQRFGGAEIVVVDQVDPALADRWTERDPALDDVAFLQYTSGSTSAPKGVMVTHGCLMANEQAIREGLSIGADDKFGVWSPLFHDMGLIGGLLQPFYSGIPCVLCAPGYFVERPLRWLQLISRHRITISGGPDFAYRLCLDRIKESQREGLDLSCWRIAYTGAEPVRHDTMAAFVERYAPAGFDAGAVYPCYGLAEATLFVTGGRRGAGMAVGRFDGAALLRSQAVASDDGAPLVGCGRTPSGHMTRIVDPASGVEAAPGMIGEIWAAGPSLAAGYWNRPDETAKTFVERDGERWLRTGDLGFFTGDELFVAGRLKDMIIVRGHNIYPQDIERAVEAGVEAVRKGRVAAFAATLDGEEGIGVAAEVSRGLQKLIPPQALADALGTAVSEQCGEAPKVIVLLQPGGLPKTSSGKLQRGACRQGWIDGSLDFYAVVEQGRAIVGAGAVAGAGAGAGAGLAAAADDTSTELARLWREVLGHEENRSYADDAHFFALGGNSLAAVQLAAGIARRWNVDFPARQVFTHARLGAQAAAVRQCRQADESAPMPIPVLSAARRAQPMPLSPGQQRLWFLWQLAPQGTAYHVQGALRLTGALDADAMGRAVAGVARRHESLRTVFRAGADGGVEQVVASDGALALQLIDLSGAGPDGEPLLAGAMRALNARPFDLTSGPLARAALIRTGRETHVLVLVMHHIISDGASMRVLVEELAARYAAAVAGDDEAPAPAALQYADYAAWENGRTGDEATLRQLAYWRGRLGVADGEPQPVLALPADRPRQPVARHRVAHHRFDLPAALAADARQLARREGTTLFTVLLAAFQALLHRHTGQHDIRVGVPVANRGRPELQEVVGFFVNTLVLRAGVDGRQPLERLLALTRESTLEAQANQELPFERLVEALQPERSLGHHPLFQVMFNHLPEDYVGFAAHTGLAAEALALPEEEAQFELALDTREHPDGRVSAQLSYACELFDASRMERLARHYLMLLRAFTVQPAQCLGDVDLLDPDDARQLAAWGANVRRYSDAVPLHRLIELQVGKTPDAPAVMLGDEALTYAELDVRANRLAHRLIGLGVAAEQRVGLAVPRSVDMVVALLAILKAGGVFVPLDPGYPAERLAAMIEDSGIRLLLTRRGADVALPSHPSVQVIALEELDLAGAPSQAPTAVLNGDNLAYVIYTSGSTGRPKGVAVAHRALVEHVQLSAVFSGLTPRDRMLQFATLNFDGFIEQLFPPLIVGAAIVLRGPALWSHDEFLRTVRERRITIADLPTAYWFTLIQSFAQAGERDYGSLREVHIGGEAMPAEAVPVWIAAGLGHVKLLNTYGPTEAVVVASIFDCAPYIDGARDVPARMPIGQPLPGRSLHVLDADLRPAPAGVAGELHIGGALLARGYLGRASLSAERFIADPFDAAGGRLYRTGDQVRWNAAGELEYLGRIDHQLKIRGFRVEPGEIETVLLAQPEVREAIVIARDDRLVAYASPQPGQAIDAGAMRARLAGLLPDYMVPGVLVPLAALPLNPNGKVDRRALPAPARPIVLAFEAPQGDIEAALATLWSEVLGVERIGRLDNFFELGGHSLLLLKLHRQLAPPRFAFAPAVVDLFRYPTVASLASFMASGGAPRQEGEEGARGEERTKQVAERATRQRQAFLAPRARGGRAGA